MINLTHSEKRKEKKRKEENRERERERVEREGVRGKKSGSKNIAIDEVRFCGTIVSQDAGEHES